jgi:ABC-type polysaccharide/polyol phosphate transport system ATPase subunit
VSLSTAYAVEVAGVSKRFRFPSVAKQATLKDLVVHRVRREGRYSVVDALDQVTFAVGRGQSLGVVGLNGSGKTTLLRILAGITKPDRGEVRMRGSVAPLLALGTGFNPYLTGRENALIELLTLGLTRAQAKARLPEVIAFAELEEFIDAPMRTYSTGMSMRLAFAAATRIDPEILLIDEVLSVGDERFAKKCTSWLEHFRRRGHTTILVTHSSSVVEAQCDIALWLDGGRVAAFGKATDVTRAYLLGKSGPMVHAPMVGEVRQKGPVKGGYDDGWSDGAFEFAFEPLRDVRGWTVRATIPPGMPADCAVTIELDGIAVASTAVSPGSIALRCKANVPKGTPAQIRIASSATVNHHALGLSGDLRDLGPRIDEIVFDH